MIIIHKHHVEKFMRGEGGFLGGTNYIEYNLIGECFEVSWLCNGSKNAYSRHVIEGYLESGDWIEAPTVTIVQNGWESSWYSGKGGFGCLGTDHIEWDGFTPTYFSDDGKATVRLPMAEWVRKYLKSGTWVIAKPRTEKEAIDSWIPLNEAELFFFGRSRKIIRAGTKLILFDDNNQQSNQREVHESYYSDGKINLKAFIKVLNNVYFGEVRYTQQK